MKLRVIVAALVVLTSASLAHAQNQAKPPQATKSAPANLTPAATSAIQKRVEAFLRNIYAWGPSFEVKAGAITSSPLTGLYEVPVTVTEQGQSDSATVYVSADGRYMFRGEIQDLNTDPLAVTRQKLHLEGYPSKGPSDAKVVLVEFADFECPSCRQLDQVLRALLPKYPEVRLVFKDFPLESIHPWAMTAAIAGRCALRQSPDIFWKFHDEVYDQQEEISPENAYGKLTDLATSAGANPEPLKACMADPKTVEPIQKSLEEGREVQVNATPTTFVNGRRVIGPDPSLLEQFIQFNSPHPPEQKQSPNSK